MITVLIALGVGVALCLASMCSLFLARRLPEHHKGADTETVVRLVAGIFTLMTSLVFGLMINSATTTYKSIDSDVHAFSTRLILLDRALRDYGTEGRQARQSLTAYVEEALRNPERASDVGSEADDTAGSRLEILGNMLAIIKPIDRYHEALLVDIKQQYRLIVEQRWKLVEQSEGTIPSQVIVMLAVWLVLIFAGFGYRAPINGTIIVLFLGSSTLIALSFYLFLDMNTPFAGTIRVSDLPLQRALAELRS